MTPFEAALGLRDRGIWPIPIPDREKNPGRDEWQDERIDKDQAHQFFNGAHQNVGGLLGIDGVADVDLDCEEALVVADIFLPETGLKIGRRSARSSHRLYHLDPPQPSERFEDPIDGETLCELRCTKKNGGIGFQSVLFGRHKDTGESIGPEPGCFGFPANVEAKDLVRAVRKVASCALLARGWPKEGSRHDCFLALAGILCRARWSFEDANAFQGGIYRALWGDRADLHACATEVTTTFEKHAGGGETTGIPTLREFLDERIVRCALKWLGIAVEMGRAPDNSAAGAERESQATKLLKLLSDIELFRSPEGRPYATFAFNGHSETHSVRSKGFRIFLQRRYYEAKGTALSSKALQDSMGVLEANAVFGDVTHPVFCRVGQLGEAIYIDVGTGKWDAIEITPAGWRTVACPPVRFRRARGMMPMAYPEKRVDSVYLLRKFLNVNSDSHDIELLISFMIAALRPTGPFPSLVLNSEAGSAKTTTTRVIRALIDPNESPARSQPRDERDLMIAASNSWIICLDNLSHIPDWLSDSLCRLSTGGGFATRELHTDEDEILFNCQRPTILNGVEEICTRGDLMDRAIVVELPRIPESKRIPEAAFWKLFETHRPGIFGYLLDGVAGALANVGSVNLASLPRMADFAQWLTAAEQALGWESGLFLETYRANRREANEVTLDASPIARHLLSLGIPWTGTASDLHRALEQRAGESERRMKSWPQSPRGVANAIKRLTPSLRHAGIEVTFSREGHKGERQIKLQAVLNA